MTFGSALPLAISSSRPVLSIGARQPVRAVFSDGLGHERFSGLGCCSLGQMETDRSVSCTRHANLLRCKNGNGINAANFGPWEMTPEPLKIRSNGRAIRGQPLQTVQHRPVGPLCDCDGASRRVWGIMDVAQTHAATQPDGLVATPEPSPRERLIDAATRLFCRYGVNSVGVDAIVANAGTAKTTLYKVFGSKDGLVEAVLEREGRAWRAWFICRDRRPRRFAGRAAGARRSRAQAMVQPRRFLRLSLHQCGRRKRQDRRPPANARHCAQEGRAGTDCCALYRRRLP